MIVGQCRHATRCGRGYITIVDRLGVEARACECYGTVEKEFTRLLG